MIRERKIGIIPSSLLTTSQYDGEDVKVQLLEDQHEKCYICERKLGTDFEIEHFKSKNNYPELRQEWTNLFLACGYCNKKKSSSFDDNLYPLDTNIENEIEQRIDFSRNKASFTTSVDDDPHQNTVSMLHVFYNGKQKMRVIKEERFFDEAKQKMNRFLEKVNTFLMEPTPANRALVAAELSIEQEMLGFKYWVIRDNHLEAEFKNEIVWNKH
ncbi:HNH endonuclease [Phocaeicola barnesiae]|uniref:HNH endonuclease n=1 Tax=Phocaeicola barnesiae TaxID=376804 RepID=UPI0025A3FF97|nr:HNH endonuclease [Phocaeicola barnesiae]MDM8250915.1 HNH endonuclease [Phocaeicola barnesiae]